jgi:transcriptional regulator with XRE-family HTH domain
MQSSLSLNIATACSDHRSIAQICREIGINRSQFMRYINGKSTPSANNLRRICEYFGGTEAQLNLPPEDFRALRTPQRDTGTVQPLRDLGARFAGKSASLRPLAGFYHSYSLSPIVDEPTCALVWLRLQDDILVSKTIERIATSYRRPRERHSLTGWLTARPNVLTHIEDTPGQTGTMSHSLFNTGARPVQEHLLGQRLAVSWQDERRIFSAPIVWKRLPDWMPAREALSQCGVLNDLRNLDRTTLQHLGL